MSQTRGELPPSNFLRMWVCRSTLPRFCSSLRLLGNQSARFLTTRQSWRMQMRLPNKILMISCISAYVIFGSFLIRDSTLETFSEVTVVAIRLQRSSPSNVLAPDMNCLNTWKQWVWTEIDLLNSVFNFESTFEKIFPGSSHNTS